MSDVTRILDALEHGDPQAADELLPLVYQEPQRLAARNMSLQPAGQTLQASALVREVYLRLGASENPSWDHRGHFFAAAVEAMRHILVDNARRKQRAKHGAIHSASMSRPSKLPPLGSMARPRLGNSA